MYGLLTAPVRELEPIINRYKDLLHKAGQEIAANLKLSGETQELLEKNFIPEEIYVEKSNEMAEKILARYEASI